MPARTPADPHLLTPSGKSRARALGVPFDGEPGPSNAITDVPGVAVGYATLIAGDGPLVVGQGPVRTGVTAILPRPVPVLTTPVFAGFSSFNGVGELTGAHFIAETGITSGAITITNTHGCGTTRDASIEWLHRQHPGRFADDFGLPVAAETYDGFLNDINGFHVSREDVFRALDTAADGAVEEGSVGGGTGMSTFEFKAGSGTASRRVVHAGQHYTVGAFVQANFGQRDELTIRGHRLGPLLSEPARRRGRPAMQEKSSIIAVVATDAPLLPHQLTRLARRATVGVARTGGIGHHGSGDIFLAFSTANAAAQSAPDGIAQASFVPDPQLNPLFAAVVDSVEEAILNSLVANADMTGRDGNFVPALPHLAVQALFEQVQNNGL